MLYLIGFFIIHAENEIEKIMRILAFSGGLLIFFGAKIADLSIPSLMLNSIDPSGGFINYFFPAITGGLITYFLFQSIKKSKSKNNQKIYFLILLSTFIILIFTDIYLGSILDKNEKTNIVINVSFLTGMILTLLFNIDIVQYIYSFIKDESDTSHINSKKKTKTWKDEYNEY
jgi:hypothetical protein